ncbi:spore germination protein KA [Caminicella sporogenes DSM 14501]|uniref:Spore germination protein KA n=1 Tax=Caminicella sporogenes DSM 14501 TaxID=1121266 RepID=A0A1M6QL82_9FIRM|nr:spore germination protein [Caminicella sporogenes]RKD25272.1 spore gernimation protein GerA [Caminicella sporogenes]WIF95264.1 spore germination protein [Caminicella sporogenes]SHK21024.1 spore germination protein KA [Caminicella sporogenes DSM 14501]
MKKNQEKINLYKKFANKIKEFNNPHLGITIRRLIINKKDIYILFIPQITDKNKISNDIIKPLINHNEKTKLNIEKMSNSLIYCEDIFIDQDENKIMYYILKGYSVIFITGEKKYIVANTTKIEKRTTSTPELESPLKAPRDSFTENFDSNLSLIRYRIKDPSLKIEHFTLGKRTKTSVAMIYLDDVANPKYVNEIRSRITKINVDGILESGYIHKFIRNNAFDLFPQAGIAERSDSACTNILEGKICIIVEGSNLALIVPKIFIEFLDSADDYYGNLYLAIFAKFLRIIALLIALTSSSLYIALVSFHPDILPPKYILMLASFRETVPFNSFLEALVMEIISELLREASIILPKQIGPAIGIVGTIVIGQAAVGAGLVSPLLVIVIALSTMCSFVAPDYTIMSPIRIIKFFLLFITGIFGLLGFTLGLTCIVINIISQTSFGIPYCSPFTPFNFKDFKNYFLSDITLSKKRPKFLIPKDTRRSK